MNLTHVDQQAWTHAASTRMCMQLANDWVAQALACCLQVPIKKYISYDELELLIVNHYSTHPDQNNNPEDNKRLRSICSIYGHIQEKLSATSKGKAQHTYVVHSHKFFQLKHVADPSYTIPKPPTVSPKLTVMPLSPN